MSVVPEDVSRFWFDAGPAKWFKRNELFDQIIVENFGSVVGEALAGGLNGWGDTPLGALALVLLLDQFPRNMWRDNPRAFGGDAKALGIASGAIARGWDMTLSEDERRWLYMPFMHSEELKVQQRGLVYFAQRLNDPDTLIFAKLHVDIIERFGRFPHRNELLGRETSAQEKSFLDDGGFAG